ncbi:MAG: hypothetical protein C0483_23770 [Pirellula sp.]|nr:hypothetical protein [Pirellula sp.]
MAPRVCLLFVAIGWLGTFTAPGRAAAPVETARTTAAKPVAKVDFNRDISPILSNNCFYCHGPDPKHREADLRLDRRDEAVKLRDGHAAIVPGKPELSELVARITSTDADVQMPPPDSNKKLTPKQIALLKRWIAEGAEYQSHWAYTPLKRPTPPTVSKEAHAWSRGPIDRFIFARLAAEGLAPADEADPATLCRRLYFDLTGLPPTPEEVDAFVRDYSLSPSLPISQSAAQDGETARQGEREKAYEALVDKLLASPQFGERMAMWWLDLVRYADTVGYHGDQDVTIWPFRDYVIRAFHTGMPFDQFTREQLAGDLLSNATREQRIASGYNRLGMMTAEGGAQDKEYLAKYAADRVRNVSAVWMGATVGCAECHDHKFDPYTARDFYSLAAFFADIKEKGFYGGANSTGEWGPRLFLTTPDQEAQIRKLEDEIASIKQDVDKSTPDARKKYKAWEQEHRGRGTDDKAAGITKEIRNILRDDSGKRSAAAEDKLFTFFLQKTEPKLAEETARLQKLNAERKKLQDSIPSTLVTEAVPPRTMRILARGNWMDETGPEVEPAVPEFLRWVAGVKRSGASVAGGSETGASPTAPARGTRLSRLDLANWLTDASNPLTPRVFANRFWGMLFGVGLSKRLDDLGAQGEPPVHPELLDYLASELRDGSWNVKALLKQIVLSSAYRQSSVASKETVEQDPFNRLYARQSRFRLPAEAVRDRALAASGLLSATLGGRSVKPYQPAGYYAQLNFPKREYQADTGENLWRRSLYTHWQRSFLHPALVAFDAPSREECTCERVRSNTPLQSLVLLNDPEFVEAARVLAERAIRISHLLPIVGEGPDYGVLGRTGVRGKPTSRTDPSAVIVQLYRFALERLPTQAELALLLPLFQKHKAAYEADAAAAKTLVEIGERPTPTDINAAELAAAASVARAVMNTHEFVTRD